MPARDHAREGKPEGYQSANQNKWEFDNSLYQKHLEMYLDHMYTYLKLTRTTRVLDVGCGEGIVYRALRERGWTGEWTGIDASVEAVEFARNASPEAKWQQGNAFEIPFPDKNFELVFCSQVMEHLQNPVAALQECARVASAWLLLSVPREPLFRALTWLSVNLKIGGDPGHVNHWSSAGFRKFVGTVGTLHTWDWTTIYQVALVKLDQEPVSASPHG